MKRIFLLVALLAGIAFGYMALSPTLDEPEQETVQAWDLHEELEKEAMEEREGWGGPG